MTNHLTKDRREPFRSEFLLWMSGFSVTFQNNRLGSIDIVSDKSRQLCTEPTFPRRFLPGTKGSLRRVKSMQRLHASAAEVVVCEVPHLVEDDWRWHMSN